MINFFGNAVYRALLKLVVLVGVWPLLVGANGLVSFKELCESFLHFNAYPFWKDIIEGLQKTGFVAAGLVVAGFQLRTRIIDLLIKDYYTSQELEKLDNLARKCTSRLSDIMLRLVLTAALLSVSPLLAQAVGLGLFIAGVGALLLLWGLLDFIAILGSFDQLEDFTMTSVKRSVRKKEIEAIEKAEKESPEESDAPKPKPKTTKRAAKSMSEQPSNKPRDD